MKAGVSIVIPSWNGLDLLKRFLPSVIAAATHYSQKTFAMTEIIIVDDGSQDQTVEWLAGEGFSEEAGSNESKFNGSEFNRSEFNEPEFNRPEFAVAPAAEGRAAYRTGPATVLKLLKNETNCGFGETCNRGFKAAVFPLVFLLNNDVEVGLDSIAPLVANFDGPLVFSAHCNVFEFDSGHQCGTGKLGSFSHGFIRVHRSYVPLREGSEAGGSSEREPAEGARLHSMFASGGSAMFDRQKFLEIGGFEKLLLPYYWEDVDISYRAWKRGYTVFYEPRSVVRHRVSSTMRRVNRRRVRRIQQRNRLIYHWINLHDSGLMAFHVLWVILLTLTAPLRFQFEYPSSVLAALLRLPEILKRRKEEKQLAQRSDRDLFNIFASLERRADVFVYDDNAELRRLNEKNNFAPAKD